MSKVRKVFSEKAVDQAAITAIARSSEMLRAGEYGGIVAIDCPVSGEIMLWWTIVYSNLKDAMSGDESSREWLVSDDFRTDREFVMSLLEIDPAYVIEVLRKAGHAWVDTMPIRKGRADRTAIETKQPKNRNVVLISSAYFDNDRERRRGEMIIDILSSSPSPIATASIVHRVTGSFYRVSGALIALEKAGVIESSANRKYPTAVFWQLSKKQKQKQEKAA